MTPPLLLATESRYKIALLNRLQIPFTTQPAEIDETPDHHETPDALSTRLALSKINALADQFPTHLILAADQTAALGTTILHKPGTEQGAIDQLKQLSGQTIEFLTCTAMKWPGGRTQTHIDRVRVSVRILTDAEMTRYVALDRPTDTVGSFKVESLGISLFNAVESSDPTALEGLGLIQTAHWLREAGFKVP